MLLLDRSWITRSLCAFFLSNTSFPSFCFFLNFFPFFIKKPIILNWRSNLFWDVIRKTENSIKSDNIVKHTFKGIKKSKPHKCKYLALKSSFYPISEGSLIFESRPWCSCQDQEILQVCSSVEGRFMGWLRSKLHWEKCIFCQNKIILWKWVSVPLSSPFMPVRFFVFLFVFKVFNCFYFFLSHNYNKKMSFDFNVFNFLGCLYDT